MRSAANYPKKAWGGGGGGGGGGQIDFPSIFWDLNFCSLTNFQSFGTTVLCMYEKLVLLPSPSKPVIPLTILHTSLSTHTFTEAKLY